MRYRESKLEKEWERNREWNLEKETEIDGNKERLEK